MKKLVFIIILAIISFSSSFAIENRSIYYFNQSPLAQNEYTQLPLGDIKASGWLKNQLEIAAKGMTGHLDEVYDLVGDRNGWLGGDGDGWERGPYWIDGLLPLAYILEDSTLIKKVNKWIEWSLNSQTETGYFGPIPFTEEPIEEPGIQKTRREDWWPHMVMLKVLQQHYEVTGDERVIELMTKYFKFQLKTLPEKKLSFLSIWAENRGGENLASVIWLYNRTGDKFLLDLAKLLDKQTTDWSDLFETGNLIVKGNTTHNSNHWSLRHGVNIAMALKQPIMKYELTKDEKYPQLVNKAISDLREYHGQVQGMYGADEMLHGTNPTQGSELCTTVELMFTYESIIPITKNMHFADELEKITFNALPAQISPDFRSRQYYQQPNQIRITKNERDFTTKHDRDQLCFGLTTGYPCCTTNLHQGWPKYVQNLYYATADEGVAAFVYAPSKTEVIVKNDVKVQIEEVTNYPFSDNIDFIVNPEKKVKFPFHLRIPGWCQNPEIKINGKKIDFEENEQIAIINRKWRKGDKLSLTLPMKIQISNWHENSIGIERGPLVYALKIGEDWVKTGGVEPYATYEVHPTTPWNYGLVQDVIENTEKAFEIIENEKLAYQPWTAENAPIVLKVKGKQIPRWKEYNYMAGPIPFSWISTDTPLEEIILIPYGCSTLRISEFPVVFRK